MVVFLFERSFYLQLLFFVGVVSLDEDRTPQPLPSTYREPGGVPSKPIFLKHIAKKLAINKSIPRVYKDVFRIVKWNINTLKDPLKEFDNVDRILSEINLMQASVVVLQEVPIADVDRLRSRLDSGLEVRGFKYRAFHSTRKARVGNMIASKVLFKENFKEKIHGTVNVIGVNFEFPDYQLMLITTHLNKRTNLQYQMRRFRKIIKSKVMPNFPNFLVACNFSTRELLPYDTSFSGIEDVFQILKWPPPVITRWKGDVDDYFLIKRKPEINLLGAYQFMTVSSAHLPLILDINVQNVHLLQTRVGVETWMFWVALGCIFVMIILSSFGFYHWYYFKRHISY